MGRGGGNAPASTPVAATRADGPGPTTIKVRAHSLRRGDKLVASKRVVSRIDQRPFGHGLGTVRITFTNNRDKLFNSRTEIAVERPGNAGPDWPN